MAALPPLAVAALYARSAGFEFVWDDWYLVVNPTFESLDVWAILGSAGHGLHYLPAGHLTLLFDTWAHGSWAGGFHLTSVVLFAAAAFLVRVFFQNLFERSGDPATGAQARELALICALVFCVHPLQVEPVAFVANRGGLVALLCWVGSLLLYAAFLARPLWALYVGTLVLTLAGLLSKATTIALPLVLFLFHMHRAPAERTRRIALLLVPHFLLSAGFAFAHVAVARGIGVMETQDPMGLLQRIPRALFTIEFYVWKFLWPTGLTIDYDLSALRANRFPLVLGGAFLFSGFVWVVLRGHRRRTLPWFLAWSYLAALVPVLNLLPTSPLVADRYAQLPLVALCPLLVAPLLVRLPVHSRRALAVLVITALGGMSVHQLSSWRDDEALQRHALAHNPESSKVLHNISMILWERGQREEALRVARELHRIDPQSFQYDYLRGLAAIDQRRYAAAATWLEAATRKSGNVFSAWAALGGAYEAIGRIDEAREAYLQALDRLRAQPHFDRNRDEVERRLRRLGDSAGARKKPRRDMPLSE